jgi:hypothetical protein
MACYATCMKRLILIGLLALVVVIASAFFVSSNQSRSNEPFATYRNTQYGFSFRYPQRATLYDASNDADLAAPVELPQLVRIVLPETYPNLKAEGKSWNYLIEISLGRFDESLVMPKISSTRNYRFEVIDGEVVYTITLDGVWIGGQEVPVAVREALEMVRDSFEVK